MKNILFTLALLMSFVSFGQLDSNGNEYLLPMPTLEFNDYPVVVNDAGVKGLSKKNLMKELKCDTLAHAGRKYKHILGTPGAYDIIPKVVSFDVSISGQVTSVKGNSIGDSSIAENLLDAAKVGDRVSFYNVRGVFKETPKSKSFTVIIEEIYVFKIIP